MIRFKFKRTKFGGELVCIGSVRGVLGVRIGSAMRPVVPDSDDEKRLILLTAKKMRNHFNRCGGPKRG